MTQAINIPAVLARHSREGGNPVTLFFTLARRNGER